MIDPRNREIFYVGRTGSPERRFAQHMEGTHQLSGVIVRQIREAGFIPHFVILEHCESLDQSCMAEMFWISCLDSRGSKLANAQTTGGYVGRKKERQARTAELEAMREAKRPSRLLTEVSNGKPARAGARWSKRDLARLRGMIRANCSPEFMADALSRTLSEIREQLDSRPVRRRGTGA